MTIEANPDPYVARLRPDPELVAIAHNQMMKEETHGHRFVRQRYEETLGALRVALHALREIYPSERYTLSDSALAEVGISIRAVEEASLALDRIDSEMLGEPMTLVMQGVIGSIEEFHEYIGWEGD